jgi:hypothetical protein
MRCITIDPGVTQQAFVTEVPARVGQIDRPHSEQLTKPALGADAGEEDAKGATKSSAVGSRL